LRGAESEFVPRKQKEKLPKSVTVKLSGIKFEDALRALLETPPPKRTKKP
jgi:hypothetical protein